MFRSRNRLAALTLVTALALAACGGSDSTSTSSPDSSASSTDSSVTEVSVVAETTGSANEPQVSLPAELPTELAITDITEGTGDPAATGDTVLVHYVGVLSKDGTRFDGNFDGDPFAVTLGSGSVIAGWEQGLVGMKQGGMRQLDIPADLAYGDAGAGNIIKPGDAISFVVEALAVVPAVDPADEPTITIEKSSTPVTEVITEDLVDGSGDEAVSGSTVAVQIIAFNAVTGEQLASTWSDPTLTTFTLVDGGTLPGLVTGIQGMKVGGRRQMTIPFLDGFGEEGNDQMGLPARTDMVLVVDLLATFGA